MSDNYFVIIMNWRSNEIGSVMGPMSGRRADRVENGALMRVDIDGGWGVGVYDEAETLKMVNERLEYIRGELEAERLSYGECSELQTLTKYIASGDVQLQEAAGVPEEKAW